jgi:hypothetical protein
MNGKFKKYTNYVLAGVMVSIHTSSLIDHGVSVGFFYECIYILIMM